MTKVVFLSCISNEFCKEMVLEIAALEERSKYHILQFWYISSLTFCQTLLCFQFHLEEFSKMLHAVFALLLADSMLYPSFWKRWPPWIHSSFCCVSDVFFCEN